MTVQEIKERNTAREWADIEALVQAISPTLVQAISPTLEENAKKRRDEEVRKAREARRKRIRNRRKANINAALHNAGIPLQLV